MAVTIATRTDSKVQDAVRTLRCVEVAQLPYLLGYTEETDPEGEMRMEVNHSLNRLARGRNIYIDSTSQIALSNSGVKKENARIETLWGLIDIWETSHPGEPMDMKQLFAGGKSFYPIHLTWTDNATTRYFAYMDDYVTLHAMLDRLRLVLFGLGVNKKTRDSCRCYIITTIEGLSFPEIRLPCRSQVIQLIHDKRNYKFRPEAEPCGQNDAVDFPDTIESMGIIEREHLGPKEIEDLIQVRDSLNKDGFTVEQMRKVIDFQKEISSYHLDPRMEESIYKSILLSVSQYTKNK